MSTDMTTSKDLNKPLYEIADEYLDLLDELEEAAEANDGIIPDGLNARFDALSGTVEQKCVRSAGALEAIKAHTAAIGAEIGRLQSLKQSATRHGDRLRDYLASNMQRIGMRRVDSPLLKTRIQLNNPSCDAEDPTLVPDEYCDVIIRMSAVRFGELMRFLNETADEGANPFMTTPFEAERIVRKKDVVAAWKKSKTAQGEFMKTAGEGDVIPSIEQVNGTFVYQKLGIRTW